jgi:hypothetical protein
MTANHTTLDILSRTGRTTVPAAAVGKPLPCTSLLDLLDLPTDAVYEGRNDQKHGSVDHDEEAHRYDSMTVMMGSQKLVNPRSCN